MVYWLIFWTLSIISGQKRDVRPSSGRKGRQTAYISGSVSKSYFLSCLEITVSFLVIFLVSFLLHSRLPQALSSLHTVYVTLLLVASQLFYPFHYCCSGIHFLSYADSTNFNCLKLFPWTVAFCHTTWLYGVTLSMEFSTIPSSIRGSMNLSTPLPVAPCIPECPILLLLFRSDRPITIYSSQQNFLMFDNHCFWKFWLCCSHPLPNWS